MQASGEHSINIQRFRNQVAAQSHDGALRFYYKELDRPLYCSGENLTIVELLEALLDSENIPIHSISHDLQERLCRTLGAAYQVTGRPHRSMHILRWSLSSAESSVVSNK